MPSQTPMSVLSATEQVVLLLLLSAAGPSSACTSSAADAQRHFRETEGYEGQLGHQAGSVLTLLGSPPPLSPPPSPCPLLLSVFF